MNSHIGYTITNAIDCHIIFEHKIIDGKHKTYCTACDKIFTTKSIQSHVWSVKHGTKLYDNYLGLPILDDAYIIKNLITFEDDFDNQIFNHTTESRQDFREFVHKIKEDNLNIPNIFNMPKDTKIKLLNVLTPGIKSPKITFPDKKKLQEAMKQIISEKKHIEKLNKKLRIY